MDEQISITVTEAYIKQIDAWINGLIADAVAVATVKGHMPPVELTDEQLVNGLTPLPEPEPSEETKKLEESTEPREQTTEPYNPPSNN